MALLLHALSAHVAGPLKRSFSVDEKWRDALVIVEVALLHAAADIATRRSIVAVS